MVEGARVVVRANSSGERNDAVEGMPPQPVAGPLVAGLGAIEGASRSRGAHRRPGPPLGMRRSRGRRNTVSLNREPGRRARRMRQRGARASRRGQEACEPRDHCHDQPPKRFHSLLGVPGGSPRSLTRAYTGVSRRFRAGPNTPTTTQAITPLSGGRKEIRRGSERAPTHKRCPAAPWDRGRPGNAARTPGRIWTSNGRALRSRRNAGGAP